MAAVKLLDALIWGGAAYCMLFGLLQLVKAL